MNLDSRNLCGYEGDHIHPKWPNNAKLAISFVLNYEEGGEHTILNGDSHSEVFLNETPGSAPKAGRRDINMETQYEYGSRVGVYRIMNLFDKFNFKFTCYAVGLAVKLNPKPVQLMVERGHEIASHNYKWIDFDGLEEKVEREYINNTIDVIHNVTGRYPVGWYTGRIGENSRRLVYEEYQKRGLELKYECDAYNDDLPYHVLFQGEKRLVIPYTLDQNDMKFCVPPGFTSPDGFFTYLKNAFDCLYEEGLEGSPKLMNIGLHCRIIGKPGRLQALKQFMEYIKDKDVWVCTREQIADHWKSEGLP